MGILSDFERRLEGAIEGIFTKAFRTGLHPVELANRILREMEAGKSVGVKNTWVPNHYVFFLSPEDGERFEQTEGALRRELEQVVRDGAKERGWALVGPAEVVFETDPNLKTGSFECEASLVEGTEPTPPPDARPSEGAGAKGRLVIVRGSSLGSTFDLDKETVVIGRLGDSDVVLSDPGVSRRHAEVRRADAEYVIADLGSTNGTMVNEAKIGERTLREGDRITVGRTVLEFRRA